VPSLLHRSGKEAAFDDLAQAGSSCASLSSAALTCSNNSSGVSFGDLDLLERLRPHTSTPLEPQARAGRVHHTWRIAWAAARMKCWRIIQTPLLLSFR